MDAAMNIQVNLVDLPSEILLIIMKKLNMVDVLYSLLDVTQRWNDLILNPLYVRRLDLTSVTVTPSDDWICSTDDRIVEQLCRHVLPIISDQVKTLRVDQHILGRVLHASNYPQLDSLELIDIDDQFLFKFMQGKSFVFCPEFTGESSSLVCQL